MVSASSYLIALVLAGCLAVVFPVLGGIAVAAGLVMLVAVRGERHA